MSYIVHPISCPLLSRFSRFWVCFVRACVCSSWTNMQAQPPTNDLLTSYLHQYSLDFYVLKCVHTVHTHVRLGRTQRHKNLQTNLLVYNYCTGMSTAAQLISCPLRLITHGISHTCHQSYPPILNPTANPMEITFHKKSYQIFHPQSYSTTHTPIPHPATNPATNPTANPTAILKSYFNHRVLSNLIQH